MDEFFTILKFAGTILSGIGAIIAAIPDNRRNKHAGKSKLRQFWKIAITKESGLYIAIIGLFVAVISQFIENKVEKTHDEEARESTDRLLNNILRMETRFNSVRFAITGTFSLADDSINVLCPNLPIFLLTNTVPFVNTNTITYSQNVVGYFSYTNLNSQTNAYTISSSYTNFNVDLDTSDGFEQRWLSDGVSESQIEEVSTIVHYLSLDIQCTGENNPVYGSNFEMVLYTDGDPTSISYLPRDKTLQVTWNFLSTKQGSDNRDINSLSDVPTNNMQIDILNTRYAYTNWTCHFKSFDGTLHFGDFHFQIGQTNVMIVTNDGWGIGLQFIFQSPLRNLQQMGY